MLRYASAVPEGSDERELIELRGWKRSVVVVLGACFVTIPLFVYVDGRIGILGDPVEPGGIDLLLSVFAVMGALLLVSGATGILITWQGVDPARGGPDRARIQASQPEPAPPTIGAVKDRRPPFDGHFTRSTLDEADPDFVDAAREYFDAHLPGRESFESAVSQVYRSAAGRPSWYFEVHNPDGTYQWIRVPHRGRAGRGAGTPAS